MSFLDTEQQKPEVLAVRLAAKTRIFEVQEVDLIIPYTAQLISQIRTIKVGPILVARKQRKTVLQLTGQGYKK